MDVEKTKRNIAVMQAFTNGEKIECRDRSAGTRVWVLVLSPAWNFDRFEYRVLPDQEKEAYRIYLEGFSQRKHDVVPINEETRRGFRALIDAVKRGEIQ